MAFLILCINLLAIGLIILSMKKVTIRLTKIPHGSLIKTISATAGKFTCDIQVNIGTNVGNVKSPISFMSVLAKAKLPCNVDIVASNWTDEVEAVEAICKYLR